MLRRNEIIVDSFAGGGGASLGIAQALGRSPDVAINHDAAAIAMHAVNHPECNHFTEDVWKAAPKRVTGGRPVGLLWASPDCKHHSRAKGSKPVEKSIRSLAWVVVKWADQCRPRVIILENVREFEEWGPLVPRQRCFECGWSGTEGQTMLCRGLRRWVSADNRHLRAVSRRCPRCDSKRLRVTEEMVPDPARLGLTFKRFTGRLRGLGYAVEWRTLNAADFGAPTHRRRLFLVARNDREPIGWPSPTHTDPRHAAARGLQPWRTAAECIDWNLTCPSIFDRKKPLADATMRRIAMGIKRYVLENPRPFIVRCNHGGDHFRGQDVNEPLCTLTASRDAHGLVTPLLVRGGQTNGNGKYTNGVDEPLTTITSKAEHMLIAPHLTTYYGANKPSNEFRGSPIDEPVRTLTAENRHGVVAAFLAKHYGGHVGVQVNTPLPTTTERGTQNQLVAANLVHMNHGDKQWSGVEEPLRTVTSGKHAALVYSFLVKYFGALTQTIDGLVTVAIGGDLYVVADIGMRMLTPRELARAQGFPDGYLLTGTNTSQVARIGNSVSPNAARALAAANFQGELAPC